MIHRFCAVLAGLVLAPCLAIATTLLGHLGTNGTVTIGAGSNAIEIASSKHPYGAGERIATSDDGSAVINVKGGRISLGAATTARLTGEAGDYALAIEGGSVQVHLERQGAFALSAATLSIATTGAHTGPVAATVVVAPDGRVRLHNQGRPLELGVAGRAPVTVLAGQGWTFHPGGPADTDVAGGTISLRDRLVPWLPEAGVAGAHVGAAGIAIGFADDDDDDDDAPPASPVTP